MPQGAMSMILPQSAGMPHMESNAAVVDFLERVPVAKLMGSACKAAQWVHWSEIDFCKHGRVSCSWSLLGICLVLTLPSQRSIRFTFNSSRRCIHKRVGDSGRTVVQNASHFNCLLREFYATEDGDAAFAKLMRERYDVDPATPFARP